MNLRKRQLLSTAGISSWSCPCLERACQAARRADRRSRHDLVVLTAALVFLINLGFALVESGFCRSKNTVNILSKNFIVFAISCLAFYVFGWGLMFGTVTASSAGRGCRCSAAGQQSGHG